MFLHEKARTAEVNSEMYQSLAVGEVPPVYQGQEGDLCGSAALWMILKYYEERYEGLSVPNHTVLNKQIRAVKRGHPTLQKTNGIDIGWIPEYTRGHMKPQLDAFSTTVRYSQYGRRRSDKDLIHTLSYFTENDVPVMTAIKEPDFPPGVFHAQVVTRVDKHYVYANDSRYADGHDIQYTHREYIQQWGDAFAGAMCVIAPPGTRFNKKARRYYAYPPRDNAGNIVPQRAV